MDFLDKIPKAVLAGLVGVGFLAIAKPIFSYIRLLLSLFVLSGKNVCSPPYYSSLLNNINSSVATVLKAPGRSSPVLRMV